MPAAMNVLEGARPRGGFLAGAVKKGWTGRLTAPHRDRQRFAGFAHRHGPNGLVQTNAFEFEGDLVKAIYAVRNPDKLRHLA